MTDVSAGGSVGSASVEVSADLRRLRRDMRQGEDITKRSLRGMSQEAVRTERALSSVGSQFALFGGTLAGGVALQGVIRLADQYQNLAARVRLVLDATDDLAKVQDALFGIAQQNSAPIEDITNLYVRLRQSIEGLSDIEGQNIARVLAQTLTISGAGPAETAAFLRQISQALASGVLRGDEFNSVMESNSRFAALLAQELGVGVGELRAMAEQGHLTATAIRDAIESGGAGVGEEAASLPLTIGRAFQQLENALARYVGEADSGLSASSRLAAGLRTLADNFDEIADAVIVAGSALAASFVGGRIAGGIAAMVVQVRAATVATAALGGAARLTAVGVGVAGTAFRSLTSLLGGPLGIALGAITLALFTLQGRAESAARSAASLQAALSVIAFAEPAVDGATESVVAAEVALTELNEAAQGANEEVEKLADFTKLAADATQELNDQTGRSIGLTNSRTAATAALAEVQRMSALATVEQALAEQRAIAASAEGGIRGRANERPRLAVRGMLNAQIEERFDILDAQDREALEAARQSIDILSQGLNDLRAGRLVIPETPSAGGAGRGSGGGSRLGESEAAREARRLQEQNARDFAAALNGSTDPLIAIRALREALSQFQPEDVTALIESILRLPGALGQTDSISDPLQKLDQAQRILAAIRVESGELAANPIFDSILGDLRGEATIATLDRARQMIEEFSSASESATLNLTYLLEAQEFFRESGNVQEFAAGAVDYLTQLARAAGDATQALQILYSLQGAPGLDMGAAEGDIRNAAREGLFERQEGDFWQIRDLRDGISDALYDGFRSGDWRDAFASALSNVMSSVLRRMADHFANWIVDAISGAGGGGGGGGLFSWIGSAIGSLFGGKRANGGKVSAGMPYLVNEPGAAGELFIPGADGSVASNRALRSALAGANSQRPVQLVVTAKTDGSVYLAIQAAEQRAVVAGGAAGAQAVSKAIKQRTSL